MNVGVITAAGYGIRLKSKYKEPKPFIHLEDFLLIEFPILTMISNDVNNLIVVLNEKIKYQKEDIHRLENLYDVDVVFTSRVNSPLHSLSEVEDIINEKYFTWSGCDVVFGEIPPKFTNEFKIYLVHSNKFATKVKLDGNSIKDVSIGNLDTEYSAPFMFNVPNEIFDYITGRLNCDKNIFRKLMKTHKLIYTQLNEAKVWDVNTPEMIEQINWSEIINYWRMKEW